MLLSTVLRLRALRPVELPVGHGCKANAAFLRLIEREDPRWSAYLHAPGPRRLYTISPLVAPDSWSCHPMVGSGPGASLRLAEGDECEWRWTSNDPHLSALMLSAADRGFVFRLDGVRPKNPSSAERGAWGLFQLAGVATGPLEHPWAWRTSHERLAERWFKRTAVARILRLRFLTPTTFRPLKAYRPMPHPRWIFASAAASWSENAPPHLSELAQEWTRGGVAARPIRVRGYTLKALGMTFEGRPQLKPVGFYGDLELDGEGLEQDGARWMNLLADLLMFSGVGVRTTWGMGQARRLTSGPGEAARPLARARS